MKRPSPLNHMKPLPRRHTPFAERTLWELSLRSRSVPGYNMPLLNQTPLPSPPPRLLCPSQLQICPRQLLIQWYLQTHLHWIQFRAYLRPFPRQFQPYLRNQIPRYSCQSPRGNLYTPHLPCHRVHLYIHLYIINPTLLPSQMDNGLRPTRHIILILPLAICRLILQKITLKNYFTSNNLANCKPI